VSNNAMLLTKSFGVTGSFQFLCPVVAINS
jgi:hypothetical protein